ncbi:MAG: very short patch repair endonuclease [Nitrosopumilus sp.]|nr:very short patch repair endonuclease [Nitrosopumilus sp.]
MPDIFTPEKRSWIMSRIRGTNTKIDLEMKKMLGSMKYKYEMYPKMFGNPDFVLPRKRIVIFCDGDFWHGYKYHEKKRLVKKFWRDKIERNMRRDITVSRKLRREGWSVLRFWEHDIEKDPEKCMRRIKNKCNLR